MFNEFTCDLNRTRRSQQQEQQSPHYVINSSTPNVYSLCSPPHLSNCNPNPPPPSCSSHIHPQTRELRLREPLGSFSHHPKQQQQQQQQNHQNSSRNVTRVGLFPSNNIQQNNNNDNYCKNNNVAANNNKENWTPFGVLPIANCRRNRKKCNLRPLNHVCTESCCEQVDVRPEVDAAKMMMMNSQNYDDIRNLTILFFLDRLVDKGSARTLHDLSCQFGTKGFTKEMRQIAGGSQSGLRKFLLQYPSLFTIDGEYVSITCYTNGNGTGSGAGGTGNGGGSGSGRRDYTQEAVAYFKDKLEQYGAAEVPIKSLLGHRSQAPLEVRHISGQHIRDFRDFLVRFPETFVVRDDYVVLTKHWESICEGGSNEGGTLERREPSPTPLESISRVDSQLTGQILGFCRSFIETHGNVAIDHLFAQLSTKFPRESLSHLIKNAQDLSVLLKMYSDAFLVHGGNVSLVPLKTLSSSSLRANSSVPGDYVGRAGGGGFSCPANTISPSAESTVAPNSLSSSSRPQAPATMSFKERLMTHLIKAVADNNAMEQRVYQTRSAPAAGRPLHGSSAVPNFDVVQANARLLKTAKIVTKVSDCQAIVAHLKSLQPPVVSFDAEGVNLGPSGPMTLLQLGTSDGQIYLFDLQVCRDLMTEGGLRDILQSMEVIKVVHDCRNDSAALYHQFGVTLQNIFDTQAAHAVLQQQLTAKPVHKVKNISLNTVCRMYGGLINPKKEQMKKLYRRDQRFWSRRPLTEDMILYAAYDIWALVPTVYEAMRSQLDGRESNPLFQQLCAEQANAYVHIDEVKQSKKHRKIEAEVLELKRKLATTVSNKTVVLSNREIRLLRHVDLTEEERDKLEGSHKVARKLERLQSRGNAGVVSGDRSNADSSEASPDIDDDEYDDEEEDEDEEFEGEKDDEEEEEDDDLGFGNGSPASPLYSFGAGRGRSSSPSLEDSIRLVEQFLANERFETLGFGDDKLIENGVCIACCRSTLQDDDVPIEKPPKPVMVDSSCQTLSTGDIVITKVYFEDKANSPKNGAAVKERVDKQKENNGTN